MKKVEFEKLIESNGSKNLSWRSDRLKFNSNDIENAFSSHWKKENERVIGISYGEGILQNLFFDIVNKYNDIECMLEINNRDRLVAATVIQWLGTNVGFCFLKETLSDAGYKIVKK